MGRASETRVPVEGPDVGPDERGRPGAVTALDRRQDRGVLVRSRASVAPVVGLGAQVVAAGAGRRPRAGPASPGASPRCRRPARGRRGSARRPPRTPPRRCRAAACPRAPRRACARRSASRRRAASASAPRPRARERNSIRSSTPTPFRRSSVTRASRACSPAPSATDGPRRRPGGGHEPLGLQGAQRLAHRGAADPERLRQLALGGERVARGQSVPGDDRLPDAPGHLEVERAAADPSKMLHVPIVSLTDGLTNG